jgi:hypothetical protein
MASRPLNRVGIDDLEARFRGSRDDVSALVELEGELKHRNTPRAARLAGLVQRRLAELRRGDASGGRTSSALQPKRPASLTRRVDPSDTTAPTKFGLGISVSQSDHLRLLAAMRATFTAEGEILARWGMTESLDAQIQEAVLGMIRERLSTSSMPDGRGLEDLNRDVARLAHLRSQRTDQSHRGVV